MGQIKYGYCLNENNELVHISSVSAENRRSHTYHCLECGQPMKPRLGEDRKWHFAHGADTACDGESYLHKLAKRRILDHFNEGGKLSFRRVQELPCKEKESCIFYDDIRNECKGQRSMTFNIRDYYDTLEEEKRVNGYVADLYFSESKDPKKEGLLIEIYVKHACDPEKISSGLKIIEAKIENEYDIEYIIKNGFQENGMKEVYKGRGQFSDIPWVYKRFMFYNFKPLPPVQFRSGHIQRFFVDAYGKPLISSEIAYKCDKSGVRISENSIAELDLNYRKWWENYGYGYTVGQIVFAEQIGLLYLYYCGYTKKNCWLCKYRANTNFMRYTCGLCTLYKKYGTPKQPTSNHAELCNCSYYRVSPELLKIEKSLLDKYIRPVFINI